MNSTVSRWLDADQLASWRAYLRGAALLQDALNRDVEAQAGLALSEYEVLVRLSEAPDSTVRMSALADDLVHSRSRLTHMVSRLEARGLVERRACPEDGRGVNCVLTRLGRRTLAAASPTHLQGVRSYFVDVLEPEELAVVGRVMARIADRLAGRGGVARAAWLTEGKGEEA